MKIILSLILLTLFVSCSKEEVKVAPEKPKTENELTKGAEAKVAELKEAAEAKVAELKEAAEAKVAEVTTKIEAAKEKAGAVTKALEAVKSGNFEVACGKCVFKDAECKTCKTYVKFAGKVYPLAGINLDPSTLGLCKTTANADVKGQVKEDSFSATSVDNLKLNLPEIPSTPEGALDKIKSLGF